MSANPYGLRRATPDDGEALFDFVLKLYNQFEAQKPSPEKVSAIVARCIAGDRALAGILMSDDGKIDATVGAVIEEFDYTDETHMMVKWFGVSDKLARAKSGHLPMGYIKWLHDAMARVSETPMQVFFGSAMTTRNLGRVLLLRRTAPMVGALHAFGFPPDAILNPARFGRDKTWLRNQPGGHVVAERKRVPA